MKKRFFSMLLALVMVLSVALPAHAEGAETTWEVSDFTYGEISQELYPATDMSDKTIYSGIGITGFSESGLEKVATNTDVVLPAKDTEGNEVIGVGDNAFNKAGLTSVKFPEEADEWIIGASAFLRNSLTSVDLSGVVYVGNNAFKTNQLTSVKFDEDIWTIWNGAFAQNAITSVEFPEKTTHPLQLDTMVFAINKIASVNLPDNTEKLHKWTFLQNTGIDAVTSGTSAEKKGGVVYMYNGDLSTWSNGIVNHLEAGTSNVQRLIYDGPVTEAEGRVYASGADALAAVTAGTGVIVDVRATEKTDNLYLADAIKQPLFGPGVTDLKDQLAFDFVSFADGNASLAGKDIYILCNSGSRGAEAATKLLLSTGYKMEDIITITGGATDNDIIAAFEVVQTKSTGEARTVTGTQAVDVVNNPTSEENKDVVIIDVRAKEKYDAGHLKGSVSLPLFTLDENGGNVPIKDYKGELATAFTTYVTENAATLMDKQIYILCNSGATGAKNAAKLLFMAGYNLDNVLTITGGAKGVEEDMSVPENLKFVSADQTLSVLEDENYVIVDVRAAEKYEAGHIEGSLSLPLFTIDPVTGGNVPVAAPYEDALSQAFLEYVKANPDTFADKTVYVLCNSGQTGAKNAFALFEMLGYTDNIYAIEGGATNESLKEIFVVDEVETPEDGEDTTPEDGEDTTPEDGEDTTPEDGEDTTPEDDEDGEDATDKESTTPKTGDTNSVLPLIFAMAISLLAVVMIGKKKFNR